jgi:hypothetical protein
MSEKLEMARHAELVSASSHSHQKILKQACAEHGQSIQGDATYPTQRQFLIVNSSFIIE